MPKLSRRSILASFMLCVSSMLVTASCGAATVLSLLTKISDALGKVVDALSSGGQVPASILTWATLVNAGLAAISTAVQMGATGLQLASVLIEKLANIPLPAGLLPPPYDILVPVVESAIALLLASLPTAQHMPVGLKTADLSKPITMSEKDKAAYTSFDVVCKARAAKLVALKAK